MTPTAILFLVLVFVVVVTGCLGVAIMLRPDAGRQRLRSLDPAALAGDPFADRTIEWITRATRPFGKLSMPAEGFEKSSVKLRFLHAGIRNPAAATVFFGVKTLLTIGLPLLGFLAMSLGGSAPKGNNFMMAVFLLAAAGYYAPNIVLSHLVNTRQREIFESFPDALDLMTVCIEAGIGTEAAMMRVADDMQFKSPALAGEMRTVNLELRAGADRERALRNLAIRTGVDEVDSFVSMICQAERFGTSIAASLRVHSDMLRSRRRQRAEEAAAKISLKLLFPLIFCIFPSLIVVLMGPAMILIHRVLLPTMAGSGG
ncbi:MAG: type II secretion system F family protein [Burkholderiales bacterium]|nr:type II secretion system F family protein [Burkholderiales bacterium]